MEEMMKDARLMWRLLWIPAAVAALIVAPKVVVVIAMFTAGWVFRGSRTGRDVEQALRRLLPRRTAASSQA